MTVKPRSDWSEVSSNLIVCLNDIRKWMSANLLKLNQDKTELMVFAPKHQMHNLSEFSISFGDCVVSETSAVKNLGVIFDRTLSMEKQVNAISRTCYMHIRSIGRIRNYITEDACKTLINAHVTSRLDYCNAVLHGINKSLLAKLQKIQNTAARLITRTRRSEHITPVLADLHWLPIPYRIQYKILLVAFKALNNSAPSYISDLVQLYRPGRALRSESMLHLQMPRTRTRTYGERRFDKAAASLWNEIPETLKKANSIPAFKKGLKTYLFKKAFVLWILD